MVVVVVVVVKSSTCMYYATLNTSTCMCASLPWGYFSECIRRHKFQTSLWLDQLTEHLKSNLHGAPASDEEMLQFYEKELLESDQFVHQVIPSKVQMGENSWIQQFREVRKSRSSREVVVVRMGGKIDFNEIT